MKSNLVITMSHQLIEANITKDDTLIDATMGNGFDTVFLAQRCRFVYAFDIQQSAIVATRLKLDELKLDNVDLILDSHENISRYSKNFKGVIYNLGYLPKGEKTITTTGKTTISSLNKVLPILQKNGFVLLVVYPKHKAGKLESIALTDFLATLDYRVYKILKASLPFQDNDPPYIIFIQKENHATK